jgi:Tol biopolymer transport system component
MACGGPTETTPPPPPAASTLAFTMDSSIYLISTDSGAAPALLLSGYIQPSWSPDGSALALVATGPPLTEYFPPTQALFLADADGGNARQLAGLDWPIIGAALWSPDGSNILFMRAKILPSTAWIEHIPVSGGSDNIYSSSFVPPSWSHDGALVATCCSDGFDLLDPETGAIVRNLAGTWPQFSPVNDDIAFRDGVGHIHLIHSDGTADRDLMVDGYPRIWSPDGKRFAFGGNDGMYMIDADGSNLSRIGPLNVEVGDVAWSADGQWLAYVTHASTGPGNLYIARSDDSDRRVVVTNDAVCCVSWRP